MHNQGADICVLPDNVSIFNGTPIFAHATIVAALIMVAWARVARHVVVRCANVVGLNNAAHFNGPSFIVHHRPAEDRIAQWLPKTKRKSPRCDIMDDIYALCADPKIYPHPVLQDKHKERRLSDVSAMPTHLARK